jgi:tRNA-Thr(GGU) m(6)t(6)A37 methyltransferase TsaA
MSVEPLSLSIIGTVRSPFREKFGVARQSLMLSEARGLIKLNDDQKLVASLEGFDRFSHLWVIFVFHKNLDRSWRATVNPPMRVDGPSAVGALASRSPHRPNPLGLSVLKIEAVDATAQGGAEIKVSGLDILDGSPVVDIKPYLPFADCVTEASSGWAYGSVKKFIVTFSNEALNEIKAQQARHGHLRLKELMQQMLELDPRPRSQQEAAPLADANSQGQRFAFRLLNFDVHWVVRQGGLHVVQLIDC